MNATTQPSEFKLMLENKKLKSDLAHLRNIVKHQVCSRCEAEKEYNRQYMRKYRKRMKG